MSKMKAPSWLRALDIFFGLTSVILSFVVLLNRELAILTLIFILSVVLLVVGIARIDIGIFAQYLSGGLRALNLGVGIFALVLAIVVMFYPGLATDMLIYLLSFALLFHGIARVAIGGLAKIFPGWLRGLLVVVGLLTIVLSFVVFISPTFGFLTLLFLLSLSFLFNGIARIVSGIIGIR